MWIISNIVPGWRSLLLWPEGFVPEGTAAFSNQSTNTTGLDVLSLAPSYGYIQPDVEEEDSFRRKPYRVKFASRYPKSLASINPMLSIKMRTSLHLRWRCRSTSCRLILLCGPSEIQFMTFSKVTSITSGLCSTVICPPLFPHQCWWWAWL